MIPVQQFVQLDAGGQDHRVGMAVEVPEALEPGAAGGDLLFEGRFVFFDDLRHGLLYLARQNMV